MRTFFLSIIHADMRFSHLEIHPWETKVKFDRGGMQWASIKF